jgi:hypothetical protein
MNDLITLEHDLTSALARSAGRRRRRRRFATAGAVVLAACGFSAAAIASGIGPDLQLDPTKWSILGGGSVDDGRGAYVHAQRRDDGSHSTFMLTHDADLAPYRAFLLHEKTLTAAQETSPVRVRVEPGDLCTAAELTRAESVAMATLQANFPPGAEVNRTKAAVDAAVKDALAGTPCRGLEYAGEQARLVYAGVMPAERLMPGVAG